MGRLVSTDSCRRLSRGGEWKVDSFAPAVELREGGGRSTTGDFGSHQIECGFGENDPLICVL